jgi:hypothetical protein
MAVAGPAAPSVHALDFPNRRVDRSIWATVMPGWLQDDYEVVLTELTLDAAPIWQRRLGILAGAILWVARLWLFFLQ